LKLYKQNLLISIYGTYIIAYFKLNHLPIKINFTTYNTLTTKSSVYTNGKNLRKNLQIENLQQ